jgi:hypothetical protein
MGRKLLLKTLNIQRQLQDVKELKLTPLVSLTVNNPLRQFTITPEHPAHHLRADPPNIMTNKILAYIIINKL